jgi:chromosome segregation ATPase
MAPEPRGTNLVPILIGAVVALLGFNVYLFLQVDKMKTEVSGMRKSILEEVSTLKESSSASVATARRNLQAMRDELEAARRQAALAAGQAKEEATRKAEDLAKKLQIEQERQKQALSAEIGQVKQQTAEVESKVGEVKTDVGSVKSDLASTKSELDKTIDTLKRATGDLGVQSGLIATNSRELSALKALGERNYFEFNLTKTKQPVRVGDIMLKLNKTDNKRFKYTVEITADDKKVEKKDKNINEPVQFYTSKARQPYEIVVNEVKKDVIVGYLATPKVTSSR